MKKIQHVLFDLDGTLLDTLPDLAHALNELRREYSLPALPDKAVKAAIGNGVRALLKTGFEIEQEDKRYPEMADRLFEIYDNCLATYTTLFPKMANVLDHLDEIKMPWGIVTNKPERFTHPILHALDLSRRSAVVVCGDTLAERKPHPAPILHACKHMKCDPVTTLYVGDADTDVMASKAAGTQSLVALYGYIAENQDPHSWGADGYINEPNEIIDWLS